MTRIFSKVKEAKPTKVKPRKPNQKTSIRASKIEKAKEKAEKNK